MTDGPDSCTVRGGSASTDADLHDMRSTAGALDTSGDDAGSLCGSVTSIGFEVPAKSALLSPGSAARIAGEVVTLSGRLGGLRLRMEFVARGMRLSATAYEVTDATHQRLLAAVNVGTAPVRFAGAAAGSAGQATALVLGDQLVRGTAVLSGRPAPTEDGNPAQIWIAAFGSEMNQRLYADPELTEGTVGVLSGVVTVLTSGRANTLEAQIGLILAVARHTDLVADETPLSVRQTGHRRTAGDRRELSDVISDAAGAEGASSDDQSTVQIRRTVDAQGKGAWTVVVPGTATWKTGTPHGPSDIAGNLTTASGSPSALYPAITSALATSMRQAGVRPGSEPVMLVGHSQGGIVAARLAADRSFRTTYDVREVVTAGSPVSRIPVTEGVQLLAMENQHDPIPRLDGAAEPDARNRVTVQCEAADGAAGGVAGAHDRGGYTRAATTLRPQDPNAQIEQWYRRNDRWLRGRHEIYEYQLRRD